MADTQDTNTDPTVRTLAETQATSPNTPPGVFNGIPVRTEDGGISNLRRNPETGELYDPGGPAGYAVAPSQAGAGAYEDNAQAGNQKELGTSPANKTIEGTFDNNTRRQIVPQPNILDRFASYTYRASVYLMSPEQFQSLVISSKKNINAYNLLFQSAGAPAATLGALGGVNAPDQYAASQGTPGLASGQAASGRNPAFDVDFYIDSITVENLVQGKSTMSAHSVTNMKFTVVEPYGITLIDRIYEAVQQFAPTGASGKGVNYGNAHYLMVIRWYGYDENGNLMVVGAADPKTGLTDPNAVVEKFIPFSINKINWSVGSRAVTYEFDCTATNQLIGTGTRRGVVPYDIQLAGTTVKEILDGQIINLQTTANSDNRPPAQATTTSPSKHQVANPNGLLGKLLPGLAQNYAQQTAIRESANAAAAAATGEAPAKANAAAQAKKSQTNGLMAALTQYQQNLTTGQRPRYDQYDEYYIEFTDRAKAIANASLVIPGTGQEAKTSGTKPPPETASDSLNPKTDSKNNLNKTVSITAGQSIVQIIDRIIRNSTFITGQQLTQIDDNNEEVPNPEARNKPVNWFSIKFRAEPKGYDFQRNDYAYKITYVIDLYPLDKYDSKYFPIGKFRGVHKSYPWWFTGQNTAVIEYSESLNTAYNMIVSGTTPQNSAAETERRKIAATMREIVTYTYGPSSEESRQGAESKAFEGAANLADSLYGSSDIAEVNMRIIGDPAWIQQGSLSGGVTATELENGSFLPDGTINYDGEQPMFEVTWNRPNDYNIETGLANPNANTWAIARKKAMNISRVYTATTVTSEFKQGKFEQRIHGLLFQLPKPDGSNKAATAPPAVPKNRAATPEEAAAAARAAAPGVVVDVNGHLMSNTRGGAAILYRKGRTTALTEPNTDQVTPSSKDAGSTTTQQTPSIQKQPAPEPPTSGSGENISIVDRALNFFAGKKINQSDLKPGTPQDQARDP